MTAANEFRASSRPNAVVRLLLSILQFFRENLGILIGFILLCVLLTFTTDVFMTPKNLLNVLRQLSTNLYLALPMTMIIILGGIDLSVGSTIAFSGVVTGGLVAFNNAPVPVALIAGLATGLAVGAFNGLVVSKTSIPPFIVTLSTMNIARGAAYVYTGGQPIRVMSDEFNFIGAGYVGKIPTPVIYLVVILIGLLAGVAGVVLASRMFSGQPTAGEGAEMDAIAAVVLGGTSMSGGVGKIGGTVIGGLVIGVLNNGLNLLNVNSFWQYIVKGLVILIAVFVDNVKKNRSSKV
jgi:ribose transport system permease protein